MMTPVKRDSPAAPEKPAAKTEVTPFVYTPPPGYTAGTPITVTPYNKSGAPTIYVVGSVVNGSEKAVEMSLKNMMHLPAINS